MSGLEDLSTMDGGETLEGQLAAVSTLNKKLRGKNEALSCAIDILQTEVSRLNEQVGQEERRIKELWKASCSQVANSDAMIASKEEEIERQIEELDKPHHRTPVSGVPPSFYVAYDFCYTSTCSRSTPFTCTFGYYASNIEPILCSCRAA